MLPKRVYSPLISFKMASPVLTSLSCKSTWYRSSPASPSQLLGSHAESAFFLRAGPGGGGGGSRVAE